MGIRNISCQGCISETVRCRKKEVYTLVRGVGVQHNEVTFDIVIVTYKISPTVRCRKLILGIDINQGL